MDEKKSQEYGVSSGVDFQHTAESKPWLKNTTITIPYILQRGGMVKRLTHMTSNLMITRQLI